jgi:hypothetical protein
MKEVKDQFKEEGFWNKKDYVVENLSIGSENGELEGGCFQGGGCEEVGKVKVFLTVLGFLDIGLVF